MVGSLLANSGPAQRSQFFVLTAIDPVLIAMMFFLHVNRATPDPADRPASQPGKGYTSGFLSPKLKWRIMRDVSTLLFESDIFSMSSEGFFAGGSFSGLDSPGPGAHTYSVQIKWIINEYRTGQAKTMDDPAPDPFGKVIRGDNTVNWEFLDKDSIASLPGTPEFRWSDEAAPAGNPIDIDALIGRANRILVSPAPRTETSFRDYIIHMPGDELELDVTKAFLMASEFKK